ncbi:MAG: inositol monophosphatase family protein [Bacteroidota bacterium]
MEYKEICLAVKDLAIEAGKFIREQHLNREGFRIETKGKHNFVTEVDKQTELLLVKKLALLLPESGFIAEEGTSSKKGERLNWVIDPLDGTTNFIHGAPPFAVSIGLLDNDELVAGVIYEINEDACFYAWKGGGAYLNGKAIRVSQVPSIDESLIATGFPYSNYEHIEAFMETVDWFMKNSHGLRRLGSAATDIAYVACGRYDGFYEYGLSPWDVAAGIVILREAGGRVTDFQGKNDYLFGGEIICSNGLNHDEFQQTVYRMIHKG